MDHPSIPRSQEKTPGRFSVDIEDWPVVILETVGKPSNHQLEEHLQEIEQSVLAKRRPFVQLVDQRRAHPLDALQRSMIAKHQDQMSAVYAEFCRAEAYVSSTELRGVMIAVFWQAKPDYPYRFFEEIAEAKEWARSQLSPRD